MSSSASEDDRPRPSKRPRSSLFLPDSDDDDDGGDNTQPPQQQPDISAIFADAENDESLTYKPLAPPLDLDALRREADARNARNVQPMVLTPHPVLPSSSPPRDTPTSPKTGARGAAKESAGHAAEGKKERRKPTRLDEESLLGPNGFPLLIKHTKNFKPKGKGHEASDLNRLLQVYQFWTHKLYPKTQFRDTVERVEKLCHSKRMHVSLSVWRDEVRGVVNGRSTHHTSDDDENHDDPKSDGDAQNETSRPSPFPSHSRPSESTASHTDTSPTPSRPPSSASDHLSEDNDEDDFDIDAFIREEGDRAVVATAADGVSSPRTKHTYGKAREQPISLPTDEDEMMWDELMALDEALPAPAAPAVTGVIPVERSSEDDEAMWDVIREVEKAPMPPIPSSEQVGAPMGDGDDDWDEMYL